MAALTRRDVEEIALLSRLRLEEEEIERLRDELTAILEHMEKLQALDTHGVEPMTHAVPMDLRLRPDEVEPSLPAEVATGQAPDVAEGCFRVPHIIKSATGE
jgi:aspartyl-tRNA(Asn)/glutamyl-tRNA(Gln) amidotransferase subunit C